MKKIKPDYSHIEHIKPQHTYPSETLDYKNMVLSCNGSVKYRNDCESCGHKRGDWYDNSYISPLENDVELHFSYKLTGEICGNDYRATEMINRLNLNCYSLVRKRKSAIYLAQNSDIDKEDLIKEYSVPFDGELPEYCAAVLFCLI